MNWKTDLVPGKQYRVSFNDCCVSGWFVGVFVNYTGEEDYNHHATFDVGQIGPDWGLIEIEEIA